MQNVNRAQDLIGNEIYDQEGQKIGRVGNVYVDDSTHQPEWVTVRTGMLGTKESFVPLQGASAEENRINVEVSRQKVREAPQVDAEQGHLSDTEGEDLYSYYGLRWPRQGTGEQGVAEATEDRSASAGTTAEAAPAAAAGTATPGGADLEAGERTTSRDRMSAQEMRGQDAGGTTAADTAGSLGADTMGSMTRYEEHLHVGTESVERGRVRLRKYVVTERESTTVPLSHEEVHIEREEIPESEQRSMGSGAQLGETEQEFVLHEEKPVVSAEPVAVERVRVNTEKVTEERTVEGDVRQERFDIDDRSHGDRE